jgi:hypothetical protein
MNSLFFPFGRPARIEPDHVVVTIEGRGVRVAIRRSARARRYGLRLPATGGDPVLTLPAKGRMAEALSFVERHKPWLATRLARRLAPIAFCDGAVIPLRGRPTPILHRPERRGTAWVDVIDGVEHLCVAGDIAHVARRVRDFLIREARRDLATAVEAHAGRLEVKVASITLKDTKSRWGSCTATGRLAFSWRIILAPPSVLDYLAAHEVAHLREMNHSTRFWRHVRATCPGMEAARLWLKQHGMTLHAYG